MSELARIEARSLPDGPLDAAAAFHARIVPAARKASADHDIVVLFDPAGHEHQGWRKAAVEELAREAAPCRVNGVVGAADAALDEVCVYLAAAPGVTGQVLAVADTSD
ncbi:hypothetical protein OZN62_13075 [Aurantiacibacter sp. MUD11]|uniref:Rossmann fold domain-containing protein n=1 Tax=Aurantiacibacter sp. MUD11 TaxID=3003265 RepID=UPI0022AA8AC0|nr:hypothetical protein [Aurantiacibacter sp. MUD11]WAT17829.1 hypothetical protein OZN62_13075 [Aurantiacibacter sp. MUD11]